MSFLDQITVLILTYNEAPNLERTLDALRAFSEVVIVDSGSDDGTLGIIQRFPSARHVVHPFESHAAQWNYGLSACSIERPWVLALDADYVVQPALIREIAALTPGAETSGYRVAFRYCVFGRPLSATLYPPIVALYRRDRACYVQEGHTQRLALKGVVANLRALIDHDDRKPLSRWMSSQQNYARLEAEHLLRTPRPSLRRVDRIRLMGWPVPMLVFLHTLFVKRCIFDGLNGWLYVLQRTLAETMIAIELADRRLRKQPASSPASAVQRLNSDPSRRERSAAD